MLRDPTAPIEGAINGHGKDSKVNATGMAARLSSANLASKHIIDKRINKMLFNMHGIPVQPNVTNQQQQNKLKKNKKEQKVLEKQEKLEKEKQEKQEKEKQEKQEKKGNRKRKQVIEQHV